MDLLGSIVGFLNEPVPNYFFEVMFLDDPFDKDDMFAMTSALASLATLLYLLFRVMGNSRD